ncbi:hypothetical protein NKH36_19000 [Mesorhizobium sp. M1312]|uniref:hypothetical protein n=1 Tax=unclassified Mesorhizobium TaxID=325217 RepID=UPI00333C8162
MYGLPISAHTWSRLTECNEKLANAGLSPRGVFAPASGPGYERGGRRALLYVGKSAGPLGTKVGSGSDQTSNIAASTRWMIERHNKSAFWQFAELFDRSRHSLAWTNVCKMDQGDGSRPPSLTFWGTVAAAHVQALKEEIIAFKPRVTLFVTSEFARGSIQALLEGLGYRLLPSGAGGEWTKLWSDGGHGYAVLTRHPQGWSTADRAGTVKLVKELLGDEF